MSDMMYMKWHTLKGIWFKNLYDEKHQRRANGKMNLLMKSLVLLFD